MKTAGGTSGGAVAVVTGAPEPVQRARARPVSPGRI